MFLEDLCPCLGCILEGEEAVAHTEDRECWQERVGEGVFVCSNQGPGADVCHRGASPPRPQTVNPQPAGQILKKPLSFGQLCFSTFTNI